MGYAGGTTADPTYRRMGDHTESFQVDFDPKAISYRELLDLFWNSHNPCGGSFSRQYRCAVFADPEQLPEAEGSKGMPRVVTAIEPLGRFHVAEDYHQKWELRQDHLLMRELKPMFPDEAAFRESTVAARLNGMLGGHVDPGLLREELPQFGIAADLVARFA